jgi:hypothetical protein
VRFLVALCVVGIVVPVALAGSPRVVTAPAPVTALAMDGRVIAFATGRGRGDCDRVRLWNLTTRAVTTLGRATSCEVTSTGTGIAALSVAGNRALWLHYTGGNLREWRLFTATTTQRAPRRLAFEVRDVEEAAPLVVGPADGSRLGDVLPYALDQTVVALRANGARRFTWRAAARVTALAAGEGELAVAAEGGLVTVLDAAGRTLREERFASDVGVVRLTGTGVLVQRGRMLELRAGDDGASRTWTLPARARLHDATADVALYVTGGQIRELRLAAANRQRQLGLGSHVQAELRTLVTATGRRVVAAPLP